jgi:hypothetical protein
MLFAWSFIITSFSFFVNILPTLNLCSADCGIEFHLLMKNEVDGRVIWQYIVWALLAVCYFSGFGFDFGGLDLSLYCFLRGDA